MCHPEAGEALSPQSAGLADMKTCGPSLGPLREGERTAGGSVIARERQRQADDLLAKFQDSERTCLKEIR